MKKELDIRGELSKRKYKQTNKFFYWIYKFVMKDIVGKKYKPHYTVIDDINKCDGPCFLVFNHLSRLDHLYAMSITYPRRINILCAYNEFFRSHLHWAFKHNNVLPKKQFVNDIQSIKAMNQIIKLGGCIAMAPEGLSSNYGNNHPVCPGTGHLFKHYDIPVYFMELRGQFLTNTKECLDERYGRTEATLKLMFSKEDLINLTEEEIENKLNEAFKHDEYEWQKEKKIKWETNGRICHHLDDMLYWCPKCHQELNMTAETDFIKCNNCGNGAKMNDYYEFIPFDGSIIPETPTKWVEEERMNIIKEIRKNKDYSFTEEVLIGDLPNDHYIKNHKTSEICGNGLITIDHDGFHFRGVKREQEFNFDLNYKQLYTIITMTDSSNFNLYINGEYHDFFPKRRSVGKILLLVEEMHRLHVNTWKNFKWNDYMYENID